MHPGDVGKSRPSCVVLPKVALRVRSEDVNGGRKRERDRRRRGGEWRKV